RQRSGLMSFDYHEIDAFTPATAVSVCHPKGEPLPLLFEFPHSGNRYPKDFRPSKDVPIQQIISGADSYMDELFEDYQALGITGIHANFPRVYLDANRHQHDITRDLLSDSWYGRSQPTTTEGTGLVWTIAQNPLKMYDRPLSDDEIRNRLSLCFIPYHQTLTMELEQLRRRFGKVYMLGCHSMRHHGFDDQGRPHQNTPRN
ncbi:MAG: N-formylglutamate amidohydrolase, partial [Cohaesibacter sp.]|nr:N-formylglutamate amidohydrolase [Cohaesibacter sp.]